MKEYCGREERPVPPTLLPQHKKWRKGHLPIFCCLGPETNYSKQFKKCLQTNRNRKGATKGNDGNAI